MQPVHSCATNGVSVRTSDEGTEKEERLERFKALFVK